MQNQNVHFGHVLDLSQVNFDTCVTRSVVYAIFENLENHLKAGWEIFVNTTLALVVPATGNDYQCFAAHLFFSHNSGIKSELGPSYEVLLLVSYIKSDCDDS